MHSTGFSAENSYFKPMVFMAMLLICLAFLQGCVIWTNKVMIQPKTSITVIDENDKSLENVEVSLLRWTNSVHRVSYPAARKSTDQNGHVGFPTIRRWEVHMLQMHGVYGYRWECCVRDPSYQTFHKRDDRRRYKGDCSAAVDRSCMGGSVVDRLLPGESTPCPEPVLLANGSHNPAYDIKYRTTMRESESSLVIDKP